MTINIEQTKKFIEFYFEGGSHIIPKETFYTNGEIDIAKIGDFKKTIRKEIK